MTGAALSRLFSSQSGDGLRLGFDFRQLVLGDEAGDLLPIAWHFLEHNRHLLGAEVATTVDLGGEAAEDFGIATAEAHTVVVAGVTGALLIGGLKGVNLDQTLDRPGGIGAELILEVGLRSGFHLYGYSVQDPWLTARFFLHKMHFSCAQAAGWCKWLVLNRLQ